MSSGRPSRARLACVFAPSCGRTRSLSTSICQVKTVFRWRRNWPCFRSRHAWSSLRETRTAPPAFRLEAVHYLLKPLDPEQVAEALNRLLAYLRPFEAGSSPSSADHVNEDPIPDKMRFPGM